MGKVPKGGHFFFREINCENCLEEKKTNKFSHLVMADTLEISADGLRSDPGQPLSKSPEIEK